MIQGKYQGVVKKYHLHRFQVSITDVQSFIVKPMVSHKRKVHDTRGSTLSKTNNKLIFKEMVLLAGMTSAANVKEI